MRRPTFGVTAFAVVTLSLIGVFRVAYEPLLPPSPTEYLVTVPHSEPQPAPIVEIGWKRTIEQGRLEAKRRKLGLLILFIDPANTYAKQIELQVLRNPEMARFVNRAFVPVKINLDQYPEWRQVTLPLQRLGRYFEPGVEMVVTNYDGDLINHYIVDNPFQYFGPESMLPFLIESKAFLSQGQAFLQSNKCLGSQQSFDLRALANADTEPLPAFQEFSIRAMDVLKPNENGILKPGSTKVSGSVIRFLAKMGRADFSADIISRLAQTPLYDPIDSGFFREARVTPSSSRIDTGKSSSGNAFCAQVIAQLACARNDPNLKQLAIDIGNEVMSDYLDGESISSSRMNDQSVDMRSKRSSLTEKKLHAILTPEQIKTLFSFVTKDDSPDQDLIRLKDISALRNESFVQVRQTLRERLKSAPGLSEPEHIAIDGYLAARLFELYRYSDDPRFLTKANELSEAAYSGLSDNSVARIYGNRELGPGWLGSYLAIADCGLADYAATGDIYPLRKGEKALKMALSKFRDPITGLLNNTQKAPDANFALSPAVPDLADRERESMNSQAIRLAFHYSVTCESAESRIEFLAFAQSMMVRLNSVMHNANSTSAGYYDAVFDVVRSSSVMVSGPNRVKISNLLAKALPFELVYPLTVVNVPKTDSIYIRRGETFEGPFSINEIQKKLADSRP